VAASARPAGVPESCTSNGATQFAKDLAALGEWDCTPPYGTKGVTGGTLTYLQFASPVKAQESLRGSMRFELVDDVENRWERCRGARPQSSLAGEAFCLRSRTTGTIEIVWHPGGTSIMGNATFDRPTTVPNALAAWKRAV